MPVTEKTLITEYLATIDTQFAGNRITEKSIKFKDATDNVRLNNIRDYARRSFAGLNTEQMTKISEEMKSLAALKSDSTKVEFLLSSKRSSPSPLPEPQLAVGSFVSSEKTKRMDFKLEVVSSDEDVQKGLMYRSSLPSNSGMLFRFKTEEVRPFWMRNTKIPLDMIFLNKDRKVVGIVKNVPPENDQLYYPDGNPPSMYCVELNAGTAERCNIAVGDTLTLSR